MRTSRVFLLNIRYIYDKSLISWVYIIYISHIYISDISCPYLGYISDRSRVYVLDIPWISPKYLGNISVMGAYQVYLTYISCVSRIHISGVQSLLQYFGSETWSKCKKSRCILHFYLRNILGKFHLYLSYLPGLSELSQV